MWVLTPIALFGIILSLCVPNSKDIQFWMIFHTCGGVSQVLTPLPSFCLSVPNPKEFQFWMIFHTWVAS